MGVPEELRETLRRVHTTLGMSLHPAWAGVRAGSLVSGVGWYRAALTSIVFAVNDERIVFVSPRGEGAEDHPEGLTLGGDVLTPARVVSLDAAIPSGGGDVVWTVTVRKRSDIVSVRVHADAEPFQETVGGEWPALHKATITFRSGESVTFETATHDERDALGLVAREFISDLE